MTKVERRALTVNWIRIYYPAELNVVGCLRNFNIICINPQCERCEEWKRRGDEEGSRGTPAVL